MSEHPGKRLARMVNESSLAFMGAEGVQLIASYVSDLEARLEKAEAEREAAYLAGFKDSAEGYNGEYPFEGENPEDNARWVEMRNRTLKDKS